MNPVGMKHWEIIGDNLSKAGFSLGWVSALDREGRTIWIVDAYRDDAKRFVARADGLNLGFDCFVKDSDWKDVTQLFPTLWNRVEK